MLKGNDLDAALNASRIAIELDPGNATAWSIQGEVYMIKHDLEAAITALRSAVKLDVKYSTPLFWQRLLIALIEDRNFDEALKVMEERRWTNFPLILIF